MSHTHESRDDKVSLVEMGPRDGLQNETATLSLAQRLARSVQDLGRAPRMFVQVNTGREPQKAGILADELPGFLALCAELSLSPEGLMCIPPEDQDPLPHFRLLRALAQDHGLPNLSMGMSADFKTAIAEGATHIRVGSAIFGARDYG